MLKDPYILPEPIPSAQLMGAIMTYEGLKRAYKAVVYSNNCINFAMFIIEVIIKSDLARKHPGFLELYEQRETVAHATRAADGVNGFLHISRKFAPLNNPLQKEDFSTTK